MLFFGDHVGARYFFSEGFGIYTEATFPILKYNNDKTEIRYDRHNQFALNVDACVNL